jgi:hypothetical protein
MHGFTSQPAAALEVIRWAATAAAATRLAAADPAPHLATASRSCAALLVTLAQRVVREAAGGAKHGAAGAIASATGTLPALADLVQTAASAAGAAVGGVALQITADPVPAVRIRRAAGALPVDAGLPGRARRVAPPAVPRVDWQVAAAGVATGQLRRALLRAAAAIGVVRGQVFADTAAATLPGWATGAVAAIGVLRADGALRAATARVVGTLEAVASACGETVPADTTPPALAPFPARGAGAAAPLDALATALANRAAHPGHGALIRRTEPEGQDGAAEHASDPTTGDHAADGAGELIEASRVHVGPSRTPPRRTPSSADALCAREV